MRGTSPVFGSWAECCWVRIQGDWISFKCGPWAEKPFAEEWRRNGWDRWSWLFAWTGTVHILMNFNTDPLKSPRCPLLSAALSVTIPSYRFLVSVLVLTFCWLSFCFWIEGFLFLPQLALIRGQSPWWNTFWWCFSGARFTMDLVEHCLVRWSEGLKSEILFSGIFHSFNCTWMSQYQRCPHCRLWILKIGLSIRSKQWLIHWNTDAIHFLHKISLYHVTK